MRQFLVALLSASIATQASAEVVSVEISEQRPWISDREFRAGGYELLSGIFHYEVDPLARSSLGITDIRLAPSALFRLEGPCSGVGHGGLTERTARVPGA